MPHWTERASWYLTDRELHRRRLEPGAHVTWWTTDGQSGTGVVTRFAQWGRATIAHVCVKGGEDTIVPAVALVAEG